MTDTTALRAIGWRVGVFERSPHALDSRAGRLMPEAGRRMGDRIIGSMPGTDTSR